MDERANQTKGILNQTIRQEPTKTNDLQETMQIEAGTREPIKTDIKRREQLRHTIEQENHSTGKMDQSDRHFTQVDNSTR